MNENPFGFLLVVAISLCPAVAYVGTNETFAPILILINTNVECIVVEISLIIDRLNKNIAKKISIKEDLKLILQLHVRSYK